MKISPVSSLEVSGFTAFEHLELKFGPGINVFIGKNGTGKTHLLKLLYCACNITESRKTLSEKILNTFRPYEEGLGRLVRRRRGTTTAVVKVAGIGGNYSISFSNKSKKPSDAIEKNGSWMKKRIESAYIPVKEMLALAPGLQSLYDKREWVLEEIYYDVVAKALLPAIKGKPSPEREKLLDLVKRNMKGRAYSKGETFFLSERTAGNLEFTLVAEGYRKLALLYLLIQNGTLDKGNVLFWDEPEANLNPCLLGSILQILLELQRRGVQIFIATHHYVVLKELDLLKQPGDNVFYHSFFIDESSRSVKASTTDDFASIKENSILEAYMSLYDRELERTLGKKK